MFMPHWNLIHSYSNLNSFSWYVSSQFYSNFVLPRSFPCAVTHGSFGFRNILEPRLVLQTFKYLSECEMREETTEGENRAEIRCLKKNNANLNRHIFKEEKKGVLIASGKRKKHPRPNPEVSGAFPVMDSGPESAGLHPHWCGREDVDPWSRVGTYVL